MDVEQLLANCEKEQLHLSGQIQQFGALLVFDEASLTITHVSSNIDLFTRRKASTLVGDTINTLSWLTEDMLAGLDNQPGQRSVHFHHELDGQQCHVRLIRSEGAVVVELEHESPASNMPYLALEAELYPPSSSNWEERDYFNQLLTTLNSILPFQRLMLHRFESDWSGEVVAESGSDEMESYVGLKFPASDIPDIARRLYFQNPSRIIPNVDESPADIVGLNDSPPDLTWSDLRSVSPVHIQYLKNMQVGASFSIPLIISGKLWGIVACHDPSPLFLDLQTRNTAEKLVRHFCTLFNTYRSRQRLALLSSVNDIVDRIANVIKNDDTEQSCQQLANMLKDELNSSTTAVFFNDTWHQAGQKIDEALLEKLDRQIKNDFSDYIFATQNVMEQYGEDFSDDSIRGVLAIKPNFETRALRCYSFRLPEAQYTEWAGNPDKSLQKADSAGVLTPRSSFKKWTEVRGEACGEWSKKDQLLAKKVRAVILSRADKFLL